MFIPNALFINHTILTLCTVFVRHVMFTNYVIHTLCIYHTILTQDIIMNAVFTQQFILYTLFIISQVRSFHTSHMFMKYIFIHHYTLTPYPLFMHHLQFKVYAVFINHILILNYIFTHYIIWYSRCVHSNCSLCL